MNLHLAIACLFFLQTAATSSIDDDGSELLPRHERRHLRTAGQTNHRMLCDLGYPYTDCDDYKDKNMSCCTEYGCYGEDRGTTCQCFDNHNYDWVNSNNHRQSGPGCSYTGNPACESSPCASDEECLVETDANGNEVGYCAIEITVKIKTRVYRGLGLSYNSIHRYWIHPEGTTVGDIKNLLGITNFNGGLWVYNGARCYNSDELNSDLGIISSGAILKLKHNSGI